MNAGARVLDGRPVAREMFDRAREELSELQSRHRIVPQLAIVRVGEEASSVAYERSIVRAASTAGIESGLVHLPCESDEEAIGSTIAELNQASDVNGIIVLQPLPEDLSRFSVADVLDPAKDIDGITTYNAGRLFHDDRDVLAPSTPAGGMALLKHYGVEIAGRHAVVVGRSSVVGKPMAMMLLAENATVTICHSRTKDLAAICSQADILVTAVGRARQFNAEFVKPGATVVDFGVNFAGGKMVGDVDTDAVFHVASNITPVPGGTGRVTTAILVRNTIKAATLQHACMSTV